MSPRVYAVLALICLAIALVGGLSSCQSNHELQKLIVGEQIAG